MFINFYRPYNFHTRTKLAPLKEKLKTDVLKWSDQDTDKITEIVEIIKSQPALNLPNFNDPFHIYTDASDVGIAGGLVQNSKVIRLFSSKLSPPQLNYKVVEKKIVAIVRSINGFQMII